MIEKASLTLESIKLVAYKLAIKQLTREYEVNKLDVHILCCAMYIHEATSCYCTAEALLPLRGRVNISSVYKSLKTLTYHRYLENTKPGKKFAPGQKGWYLVTPQGRDIVSRFEQLCIHCKNQLINRTGYKEENFELCFPPLIKI